ncbi:MAG: response regulator [Cyclobacteriaceae bacterium]
MNILLVENQPESETVTRSVISAHKFRGELYHLTTVEKALHFLFHPENNAFVNSIGLILLDIDLPRLNGIKVLQKIKESHLKAIPTVVLTHSNEKAHVSIAYNNYVNSYIRRPDSIEAWQALISKLMEYWTTHNMAPCMC